MIIPSLRVQDISGLSKTKLKDDSVLLASDSN